MALLDFLKNKKEKDRATEKKAVVLDVKKETKTVEASKTPKVSLKEGKFSYSVIKEPHISEKATYLGDENKYAFKVYGNANKVEIKKSVEGIYGVNVLAVNVITIPNKKRRMGKTEGFKKGYKKALVTIKEGQKIEIF
ncbi:MAG: 50S ribosomal protein L23 [Candidatus Staskawiczbacteria bacterium]|nr:50S ribosomal protein L23 [Candidatus Staskawiczbacteria bacterium]